MSARSTVNTVSMRKIAQHVRPARERLPRCTAVCLVGLALATGCGSSTPGVAPADQSIEQHLLRGVRAIRQTRDPSELRPALVHIVAHLRRVDGIAPSARHARKLAIQGFEATLEGTRSQIEFIENDSGEVAEATKDARRADLYLRRGANLLRAAGRALGVRIGDLNGH